MRKIVINRCYGGFGLSEVGKQRVEALSKTLKLRTDEREALAEWAMRCKEQQINLNDPDINFHDRFWSDEFVSDHRLPRDLPALVQAVEELGAEANGCYAELAIVEIPDDVEWEIAEYDGLEHVAEVHRKWY